MYDRTINEGTRGAEGIKRMNTEQTGGNPQNRIESLDLIRALAAFFVVLHHTIEFICHFQLLSRNDLGTFELSAGFFLFTIAKIGVPFFLMLTGFLLLSRKYESWKDVKNFYLKHLLPLFITWEIWILIYNVFLAIFNKTGFDFLMYLRNAFFIQHTELTHTWYMPAILGIYLFLPLLGWILSKIPGRWLLILLAISYAYFFIVPSIRLLQVAWDIPMAFRWVTQLDLSFAGGKHALFVLLGYCFKRWENRIDLLFQNKILYLPIALVLAASLLFSVPLQIVLYSAKDALFVGYDFFLLPIVSASAFALLKRIRIVSGFKKCCKKFSECSFGIYLLHVMFLMPLLRIAGDILHGPGMAVLCAIGLYLISFLLTWVLSLIPGVGKVLFHTKPWNLMHDQ